MDRVQEARVCVLLGQSLLGQEEGSRNSPRTTEPHTEPHSALLLRTPELKWESSVKDGSVFNGFTLTL